MLLPQLRTLKSAIRRWPAPLPAKSKTHLLGAGYELRTIAEDFRDHLQNQPSLFWFSSLDAHVGTGGVFAAIYIIDSDN